MGGVKIPAELLKETAENQELYELYGDKYLANLEKEINEMPMCRLHKISALINKRNKKHNEAVRKIQKIKETADIAEVQKIVDRVEPMFKNKSFRTVACSGCYSYGDGYANCGEKYPNVIKCSIARSNIRSMFK